MKHTLYNSGQDSGATKAQSTIAARKAGGSERDSSGTTREARDGADSPTQATEGSEAARPKKSAT